MADVVSGVHTLVTGLNGHGKTLYTVAEKLRPMVGAKMEYPAGSGNFIERRLCIGGIRNLLLPHELIEVPAIDPESWKDEWRASVRDPGQAPLDVPMLATNWWCWAMPGDVIVIDECQRLFRPMASGRRVPMFIEKLETARHYGVQFVYITQHPQLVHTNVRSLVGPHQHVARVFGTSTTTIYEWAHCSNPDRIKQATVRTWRHSKAAFGLYHSAEVHTKFRQRLPWAVYMLALALVALVYLGWKVYGGMSKRFGTHEPVTLTAADPNSKHAESARPGRGDSNPQGRQWPVLNAAVPPKVREPFHDRGLVLDGSYRVGARTLYAFGLLVDGQRVASVSGVSLLAAGYAIRELAPCAVVLVYGDLERAVTCSPAVPLPPAAAASSAPPVSG